MLKVITGPMFSGKSEVIIAEYEKRFHKNKILLFKPRIDIRDYGVFKTRNGKEIKAQLINDLSEILSYVTEEISTIFIDEANFLTGDSQIILDLSINDDIDIIVAGLNLTSEQKPFGIMPELIAIADEIVLKTASCNECNRDAIYTYYEGEKRDAILVGNDGYIALCAKCLRKKRLQKTKIKKQSEIVLNLEKEVPYGN